MGSFVFFGGKGGVGKTTVASAYALQCSQAGVRTLVVSTDPAHSTSDVFEQEFGDEPTPVEGYEDLSAMEIDPTAEIDEHLQETKRALDDHVSASMVNAIDRQIELAHRTPGAYEAALFDRFIDVMADAEAYDRIVFDTAPTGGTLRLLSLPDALDGWIERLIEKRTRSIDLFEKAAIGDREARRKAETDPIIARLRERKDRFEFAGRMLRDSATFYLVLTPDELSIRETRRTIEDLTDHDLPVSGLIVNRLTPQPDDDEQGQGGQFLRQRCATERERLDTIRTLAPPVVATIQTRAGEIKGDLLDDVASGLSVER
ncbi:ArsA family ATPase [Halocatena salina]|uniref:ArsA family ATPase n=1 Tax=Halocatena salina TaxID=2934340 RepID=A0A8U0A2N0_9EURY|nr:ArsA family ATPase [Halocatena salina]UPM42237.1 ArsA family ATPase [Halocatena salina]